MIARIWRGATRAADADAYVHYLLATGLREYRATPGNRGAFCFRRRVGDRTEFVTLSLWESEGAVKAFAGEESERAVFYPEDERCVVEKDLRVDHYEVVFADAATAG